MVHFIAAAFAQSSFVSLVKCFCRIETVAYRTANIHLSCAIPGFHLTTQPGISCCELKI